jgi:hypothetical protein
MYEGAFAPPNILCGNFYYFIFNSVPDPPATVVGNLPSHAFHFTYSMYSGDN